MSVGDDAPRARSNKHTTPSAPTQPISVLAAYVRLWAVATATRVLSRSGAELRYNEAVALCAVLTFCFPLRPTVLLSSFGCRIAALLASLPYIHDSQHWCLQTDLAVAFAAIAMLRHRLSAAGGVAKALLERFGHEEAEVIALDAASTVRTQFRILYLAAALYKFNSGFMDPKFSCAPVFLLQLLEQNLPPALLHPTLLRLTTQAAPSLILATEALIPTLLWLRPRCGVAFAALFHWAIALTPPPNDIASFGVQTLPRMLLLVPEPAAAASVVSTLIGFTWQGAFVVAVAATTAALQESTFVEFDIAVPVCGGLAAVMWLAAWDSASTDAVQARAAVPVGAAGWVLRILAWAYALLVIPLGLMDMGAANMFSSLRMHGGSNHFLLPTNVLQRIFLDASPSSLAGEIFGGGVARVEGTNSTFLTRGVRYPGELLHSDGDGCCRPAAVAMLRASGHSGRQWSPMAFACAIGNQPTLGTGSNASILSAAAGVAAASAPFQPYTVPTPELRRLLRDARARHPTEDFVLSGALLPGAQGDETWRARAASARFAIHRRHATARAGETLTCTDEAGDACDTWVAAQLLTEPSGRWLAQLASKLLLQQPYPLVAGDEGAHRRVHCFGP